MASKKLIDIICIIIVAGGIIFLINRYTDTQTTRRKRQRTLIEADQEDYLSIQKYLLLDADPTLAKSTEPILWIPIHYEYNSRNWQSFGSRSSFNLNQPYIHLTVKSIIMHCHKSFRICIIDDSTFTKLIPDWRIDMKTVSHPISTNLRTLGHATLLSIYGGIIVPPSFLCLRDLIDLYQTGLNKSNMFVCETVDRNITSTTNDFYPNVTFMGARKESQILDDFIDFIQRTISKDYTAESVFKGEFNRWCNSKINKNKITLITAKLIGTSTLDGTPVYVDDLLSNNYIDFYDKMYGIYIPSYEILKRVNYQWFSRLSCQQVLKSNTIIGKYILIGNAPDENMRNSRKPQKTNSWISYWQVPSQISIWGLKPQPSANFLLRSNHPSS